jgi:methionyl aminopeptidase
MTNTRLESTRKAGAIVIKVKEYAKELIKPEMPLLEIADKIEAKIEELEGEVAFPTTLGINEYTAHYTPNQEDETKAHGLLKVDFGVSIEGFTADNAFSMDLEDSEENKKLIKASEDALQSAIEAVKENKSLGEIGQAIQDVATNNDFSPIKNLSGHGIDEYELHTAPTIPNFNNNSPNILEDGVYAIEPFITTGIGEVYDGKPSGIYELRNPKNVRDPKARELLEYIGETHGTLPFCSRWLVKKFGTRALISLRNLESAGVIHQFDQLIEKSKSKVAQTEATLIIENGKVEVVT